MCLGEPARVREIRADGSLLVESAIRRFAVSPLPLTEPAAPGEWVLTHAGYALARLSGRQAADALAARAEVP